MKKCTILILLLAMVAFPLSPAYAQKTHIAFYKQFNAAIEAGDLAAAAEAGEKAWRAAEDELGDNQTTAVLAYNYAAQIYYGAPEKAIEPLERVLAIAGEDSGLFGDEPPALMLAFVRAASEDDWALKPALRKKLVQFEEQSDELTLLNARSWLHVASGEMSRNRYSRAENSAESALRHYALFRDFVPREYVNGLMARGISRVAGDKRSNADLIDANYDFAEAIEMFPPQKDIETFDPLLAAAVAWDAAVRAAAKSDNPGRARTGSRVRRDPPPLDGISAVRWDPPRTAFAACEYQWKSRKAPRFPQAAADDGFIGGVLVGYHFDGVKVTDARILGEVPQRSSFGEATLRAIETWELESPPQFEGCKRNMLTTIHFILG